MPNHVTRKEEAKRRLRKGLAQKTQRVGLKASPPTVEAIMTMIEKTALAKKNERDQVYQYQEEKVLACLERENKPQLASSGASINEGY